MLVSLFFASFGFALVNGQSFGKAEGGALDSTHPATLKPTVTTSPGVTAAAAGPLTINVHNSASAAVSVVYGSNAGAPPPISAPTGGIAGGGNLRFVAPQGWAGRLIVGRNTDYRGSKIEASLNGQVYVDVSYVDGYSLPIVCSCDGGGVVTGCAKPLFQLHSCANQVAGPVCINPSVDRPDGPPTPFFAPCRGAAYTFPNDNGAVASCPTNTINCCVGRKCPHDPKEPPSS